MFDGAKLCTNAFNTFRRILAFFIFIFVKRIHSTCITSLPVPHANLATQRNDELKKQGGVRMAESSYCVKAFVFWNAAKLAGHKSTVHLNLNNFAAFYAALLASSILASWFFSTVATQTKNYLVHMSMFVWTYACLLPNNDVINLNLR